MTDIKRIQNLIDEWGRSFRDPAIMNCDSTIETDETIQLYVKSPGVVIDFFLYAMIELDINKRLEVYEEASNVSSHYPGIFRFNGSNGLNYHLRYADYRDSIIMEVYFFRALFYANSLNRPKLYRNLLEIGGERHFEHVKILLETGSLFTNNVECRAQLIDYINKHNEKEDIEL